MIVDFTPNLFRSIIVGVEKEDWNSADGPVLGRTELPKNLLSLQIISVLVVGGAPRSQDAPGRRELARRAHALMRAGTDRKEALATVARESGVPRRAVFDALVEQPDEKDPSSAG